MIAIGGAITAMAYAYSAYVPARALLPTGVIAAAAVSLYSLATEHQVGIAFASAVAAVVIGLASFVLSGRVRVPALVIVTAAIVPLLPGLSIYRGLATVQCGRPAVPAVDRQRRGRRHRAQRGRDLRSVPRPAAAARGAPDRGPARGPEARRPAQRPRPAGSVPDPARVSAGWTWPGRCRSGRRSRCPRGGRPSGLGSPTACRVKGLNQRVADAEDTVRQRFTGDEDVRGERPVPGRASMMKCRCGARMGERPHRAQQPPDRAVGRDRVTGVGVSAQKPEFAVVVRIQSPARPDTRPSGYWTS